MPWFETRAWVCKQSGASWFAAGPTINAARRSSHTRLSSVFGEQHLSKFPLAKTAWDHGGNYNSNIARIYLSLNRFEARASNLGHDHALDGLSANPVTVRIAAFNGDGISTNNENDLCLVAGVRFGKFDAMMWGDSIAVKTGCYEDIVSSVDPKIAQVEVHKANHHYSQYSRNPAWLETMQPRIGIRSVDDGNGSGQPTEGYLGGEQRLGHPANDPVGLDGA